MKRFRPLREFIQDRLYHKKDGYFCKSDLQLGELQSPINFRDLIGFDDYQKQLYQRYPKNAWLTPSQIFKPYYGMTVANYIKQAHQRYTKLNDYQQKIRIVQAGAGTGSAAESILYFFQNYQPKIFQKMQYTIVEISPILCGKIQKKLSQSFSKLLKNKQITIINDDIANFRNSQLIYCLFFEVLDNMPHDKILWSDKEKEKDKRNYENYCTVDFETKQQSTAPINKDLLVQQCFELYNKIQTQQKKVEEKLSVLDRISQLLYNKKKFKNKSKDLFLPTYLLYMMKNFQRNVPKAHFVMSDFDDLISQVPGIGAPIVSTKGIKSPDKKDYSSYLTDRGQADIFFPTNFQLVKTMHQKIFNRQAQFVKSHEFIKQFSFENWATTKSGYNPIQQDFINTSFLITKI